jgi:hypothetical protein
MRPYSYFSPLICGIVLLFLIAPVFEVKRSYSYKPIGKAYGYQLLLGGINKVEEPKGETKPYILDFFSDNSDKYRVPTLLLAFGLVFFAITGVGIYFIRAKLGLQIVYAILFLGMFCCVLLMRHEYMEVKDRSQWVEVRWPWHLLMLLTVSGVIWSIYRTFYELNRREIENPSAAWRVPPKFEYDPNAKPENQNQ